MEILANSYHVGRVPRHPRCVGERLRIAGRGTIYFGLFWGRLGSALLLWLVQGGGVGKLVGADEIVW